MKTSGQADVLLTNALRLAGETACDKVFLFLNSEQSCQAFIGKESVRDERIVPIIPKGQNVPECLKGSKTVIHTWSGNQTRFSRIKYAFMQAVMEQIRI